MSTLPGADMVSHQAPTQVGALFIWERLRREFIGELAGGDSVGKPTFDFGLHPAAGSTA
jgi:hypothetical protein